MATMKELRDVRIEKLKRLREMGIDPYPARSEKDYSNAEIVENFEKFDGKEVTLAGRLMSWREHGQLVFADLQDFSGKIPLLEHVTGGADANPFVTHHEALDQDFYLRISTELYQKRLIGAGFEKVFTLGPNFRNEGLSDEHLQEYYQVEWYWAYADYRDNMEMVKEMFRYIAKEVYGTTKFTRGEHSFDLADDWKEIDYAEAIKEKLGADIFKDSEEKMLKVLKDKGVKIIGDISKNRLVDNLWKVIRQEVSGPAFLINEPKFVSPLAKSRPDNPDLTERFHVILAGSELGNGYSGLNDPQDQPERVR